jgi:hypothetical protein
MLFAIMSVPVAHASVSKARRHSVAALSPAGAHQFLVEARDGVIQVGLEGGTVKRQIVRDARRIRFFRERARKMNQPLVVLNEPVAHVARRLDTVRHLNDTAWTAMNLLVSLQLDRALAQGSYKYVVLSDPHSYVLLRQGSRQSKAGRGYTGIKIFMGKRTSDVNATLQRLGYDKKDGVVLDVAELPKPSHRALSSTGLMLRVQNRRIGDSPILERLISVQEGA